MSDKLPTCNFVEPEVFRGFQDLLVSGKEKRTYLIAWKHGRLLYRTLCSSCVLATSLKLTTGEK